MRFQVYYELNGLVREYATCEAATAEEAIGRVTVEFDIPEKLRGALFAKPFEDKLTGWRPKPTKTEMG